MLIEWPDYFLVIEYTMPGKPRGGKRKMWKRKPRVPRRQARTVNVNSALQPIPQRYICKLKYAEDVTTDGLTGTWRFNLNSLFDPNQTGTGHQPYGFDQLATLYNKYRVISCGWRITSPSSTANRQVGAIPANEAVSFATFAELKENPRAKYVTQMLGGNAQMIRGKSYLPSLVGRTKAQYMADDRYQAFTTGSPAELAILNILTANQTGVPVASDVNILLEYTVEFFDVKPLAQS